MPKYISVQEELDLVKDGDYIVTGMASAEAVEFCTHLHEIAPRLTKGVTFTNCLAMNKYEFINNPIFRDKFNVESWFFDGGLRKNFQYGNISFIPNHLHFASSKRLAYKQPDIYVGSASMPDKHGYVSLLSDVYEFEHIKAAKTVILECSPNVPRVFGDTSVNIKDVDYIVECDYGAPIIPEGTPNEKDIVIGNLIADYIHDGDCIQVGIGGIPDAVVSRLFDKKDLGVHTEMMTTGMMRLAKAGVITGAKKQLYPNKIVATFAAGTKELYEYIDDNPSILIMDGSFVNNPYVIAQNDNQISINTSLEVDLAGQCCSESLGSRQFSGAGGQADTAVGAK